MKKVHLTLLSCAFLFSCGNKAKESESSNKELITNQEQNESTKDILFVITSHDELGNTGDKTGVWLEEFAGPYYFLKDKGVNITLASPKGGQPPIDPKSELADFQTSSTRRFGEDLEAQNTFAKTLKLESIKHEDYDAVFYTGGYGPLWDLADNEKSIALVEGFYNSDKPVATVCHGPAIFKNAKDSSGKPLVSGKNVTSYSNSEEAAIDFTNVVPFSVEDALKENGGIYSKGPDWNPYAVEDGLLITGQNPMSSELVAEMLLEKLD